MRVWLITVMIAMFAGCAGNEEPAFMDESDGPGESDLDDTALPTFLANVTAPEGNVTAGLFNFTIDGPANATWSATLFAGSTAANLTNGMGLPANVTFDVLPGNYTLFVSVALPEHEPYAFNRTLVVTDALPSDPCVDAVVQEAYAFTGTASTATGNVDHVFFVGPCQTGLVGSIEYIPTGGDIDIELYDPTGKEVDSAAAFGATEADVSASGNPFLMEGDWTYRVVPFASAYGTYDVTVTFS